MIVVHVGVSNLPEVRSTLGGAIQRRIWELARAQAADGHAVVVHSVGHSSRTELVDGVTIQYHRCASPLPLRHGEFLWRAYHAYRDVVRSRRDGVVHFHSQPEGVLFARRANVASVLSYDYFQFRGTPRSGLRPAYARLLRQFDALLPCSHFCLQESRAFWGFPPDTARVLHNGVNSRQFHPGELPPSTERPVVLYLGRSNLQKGTDVLVAAARILRDRGSATAMTVAGPIDQFDAPQGSTPWQRQFADAGVAYLGPVEEGALAAVLRSATIVVMPSRTLEMFGMAALEALASGVPVIASNQGGLPEVVGDAGVLVPPGDPMILADAIDAMLNRLQDSAQAQSLRARARQRALDFDWSVIARQACAVYADANTRRRYHT